MPRVVDKPNVPQVSAVDKITEKLSVPATEILQRAIYEQISGNIEAANRAWLEYERKLAHNSFIMLLAGHAAVVKRLKRRKLTPPRIRTVSAKFSIELQSKAVLPFLEAARVFSKDIPEVEGLVEELIRAANSIATAFTENEKRTAPRTVVKRLLSALSKAASEGNTLSYATPEAVAAAVQSSLGFNVIQDRMATDYRTALMDAFNAGSYQRMQESKAIIPVYMLSEIKDRRTRGNPQGLYPDAGPHYQMDGFCAPADDPIWGIVWPPNGYNSFLPETRVSGRFCGGSKASYSGPVVYLDTARGNRLAVTVNHPVLTDKGFVAAGQIRKGDNLVTHGRDANTLVAGAGNRNISNPFPTGWAVDDQECIPTIEDVFEAMSVSGGSSFAPGAASLDFHGDGAFMYGDIHIVRPNGLIPECIEPEAIESIDDLCFMQSPDSPLFTRHGLSALLADKSVGFGVASKVNAPKSEFLGDPVSTGADLLGKLEDGYPGVVTLDEVVNVDIRDWVGHVYDLQSPNGWIVADGIVCSNCRADVIALTYPECARRGWIAPDGRLDRQKIHNQFVKQRRYVESGEYPDKGFAGNTAMRLGLVT